MPTFIMLTTLTSEGVQTVKNNPSRIREVNRELEQLGVTLKAQVSPPGRFHFAPSFRRGYHRSRTQRLCSGGRRKAV